MTDHMESGHRPVGPRSLAAPATRFAPLGPTRDRPEGTNLGRTDMATAWNYVDPHVVTPRPQLTTALEHDTADPDVGPLTARERHWLDRMSRTEAGDLLRVLLDLLAEATPRGIARRIAYGRRGIVGFELTATLRDESTLSYVSTFDLRRRDAIPGRDDWRRAAAFLAEYEAGV